ncbi:hypothetical protein LN996_06220 [Arthrobacter sp. AK01]|uniref:hypothetical protein n=1 Tax=Micrococcaceae TaxID=1268 RepID=UPI001E5F9295|nr:MULTISPECIES: hypothetical protein [Micrococcaceae]MCD4850401.1 hypothetical protein [Arthrobacter sp. AK01]MCP1414872.1 hypothetical protein [Paenarthrobacter sp. A20]
MQDQEEGSTESEADDLDPTVEELLELMEAFRSNQDDLLYTADYIERQEHELDDYRERAHTSIEREYPHVPEGLFERLWDLLEVELEGIGAPQLKSDKEGLHTRDTEQHKDAVRAVIRELPEDCGQEYFSDVARAIVRMQDSPQTTKLLSSLLTTVVADFEVLMGNLLRVVITNVPQIISSSNQTFTWAQICEFEDLESFRQHQIDKFVDSLLYGSYSDWLEFVGKKLHIDVPPLATDASTIEIFQRRHMIVHNGAVASKQYVEACKPSPHKKGLDEYLGVDVPYLRHASDRLMSIATFLVFATCQKFVKDQDSVQSMESYVGGVVSYHLLQDKRFEAVQQLSQVVKASSFNDLGAGYRYQVNSWVAAKRTGQLKQHQEDIENWNTSVLQPVFRLAKHALLDELTEGHKLVQKMRASDELPLRHWLTWPLLSELRDYSQKHARVTSVESEEIGVLVSSAIDEGESENV